MIIHSVSAKNVLKYETLELNDLPQEGVIAISGFNESGKSTIGETICFALFGRTFSIKEDELEKIIRWGESDCSVTIQFSNDKAGDAEGERYAITRMLDCDGNHAAKLFKVYNEENPIARGIDRVDDALYELVSVEFEEFIESFYLAQREITTPHPHSYALKTMAGIATMEYCDVNINEDIKQELEASGELGNRITQLEEDIDELELEDGYLDSLTGQHNKALDDKANTDEMLANYQNGIEQYHETAPKIGYSRSKTSRGAFWRFIYFILAAGGFGLWWILLKMPEHALNEQVSVLLQNHVPKFTEQYYPYLLYVGGIASALFLASWAAIVTHRGNLKRLGQAGIELAEKMRAVDSLRGVSADEPRQILLNQVEASDAEAKKLDDGTVADLEYLKQQQEQQAGRISELSSDLVAERERVNRAAELLEKIDTLQAQIDDKAARNQIRELATELLTGACRHLSKRFNHIIREHVGKTLPLFTENRYEHLQIDDDLTVRVFSNEKHDFMDLDEISSGTQRQIMLAVRLALSQEMVSRKVHSRQFLILDEPFAFFDEERTSNSLGVLPKLSNDLPQIWIIAQTFPEGMNFERNIYCERNTVVKTA